jgi:imidazoleglycerol-phosphate dehydratase
MDEALSMVAIDFSNRGLFVGDLPLAGRHLGEFDAELVAEFLRALANHAGATLHVRLICGDNLHHQIEAVFKGLGRAIRQAVSFDTERTDQVPSTKGVL